MAADALPPSQGSERAVNFRANRVEKVLRKRDVVTLAAQGGYSDQEIADLLSSQYVQEGRKPITRRMVTKYRGEALEEYKPSPDQVDRVRAEQLQRLDELTAAAMPKAQGGNLKAIETVLKIERERAAIIGTAAPKRVEVGGRIDHVHDLADPDEVERLEEAFKTSYDYEGTAFELPDDETGALALPAGPADDGPG
jgi:translation elongation factor EF-Tu-like GTPase